MSDLYTYAYYMFLPLHVPSKSRVLAMVNQGEGPVLEAVATFAASDQATTIANLLNAALLGLGKGDRLTSALEQEPASVRASITKIVDRLTDDGRQAEKADDTSILEAATVRRVAAGLALFPTLTCQECEVGDSTDVANDGANCPVCSDWDCEDCSVAWYSITPRTAGAMYRAAVDLGDNLAVDVWLNHLEEWPMALHRQDEEFYVRLRACFQRIADALADGDPPNPTCAGDEIALELTLDHAAAFEDDEFVRAVPGWKFDFLWDNLITHYREEYEDVALAVLDPLEGTAQPLSVEEASELFEPFHSARVRGTTV